MADTDWSQLEHANGPATRVPQRLKQLVGKNAEARVDAFDALRDMLVGQAKWFSASAPAVTWLLAAAAKAPQPELLLVLAAEILGADHLRAWLAPLDEPITEAAQPSFDAALDNQSAIVDSLKAKRGSTRAAGVLTLAMVPTLAEAALPKLIHQAETDKDEVARASALLTLARLAATHPECARAVEAARNAESVPVRGAATLAWLRMDGSRSFGEIDAEMAVWLRIEQPPYDNNATWLPWFGGLPVAWYALNQRLDFAAQGLAALARHRSQSVALVDSALRLGSAEKLGAEARRLGKLILELSGFTSFEKNDIAHFQTLSPDQQSVARRLALTPLVPLSGYGLPALGAARRRWSGISEPGPLEQVVMITSDGGKVEELPRWLALRKLRAQGASDSSPLPELLSRDLTPLQRWQAIGELESLRYPISCRLDADEREEELAVVSGEPGVLDIAREMADDLSQRCAAAARDGENFFPNPSGCACALLPLVRAGRPIEERWEGLVCLGADAHVREIFAALTLERREARILDYLPASMPRHSVLNRVNSVIALVDLAPTQPAIRAILAAIERYAQAPSSTPEELLQALDERAAEHPELKAALAIARQTG